MSAAHPFHQSWMLGYIAKDIPCCLEFPWYGESQQITSQNATYSASYSEWDWQEKSGHWSTQIYHRLFVHCLMVKGCLFQNPPTVFP